VRSIPLRLPSTLRWSRTSYILLSGFLATVALIVVVWWPLASEYLGMIDRSHPLWMQVDWLLIGIFLAMTILIMGGADLRKDVQIVVIGLAGGLTIEAWGTQTLLWTYYTSERPPLWIIPAWPIASLAIDRLYRLVRPLFRRLPAQVSDAIFCAVFAGFYLLMLWYTGPTIGRPLTVAALILCALLVLSPGDRNSAVLAFLAGAALGYFLELWGTTRECWTYYTREMPPLFAVLAHGMAAMAFWRTGELARQIVFPRLARAARFLSPAGRTPAAAAVAPVRENPRSARSPESSGG
jgi:hypothetical protein